MNIRISRIYKAASAGALIGSSLLWSPLFASDSKLNPKTEIEIAEADVHRTAAEGFLWRDTMELLASAKTALAADKREAALELAQQARAQALGGHQQYERARQLFPNRK